MGVVRSVVGWRDFRWLHANRERFVRETAFHASSAVRTVNPAPIVRHEPLLACQLVFASSPGARRRAVSVSGAAIPRGLARR